MSCHFKTHFFVNINLPNNQWKNHLTAFLTRESHKIMGCNFK